jgi:hypothetical protein
LSRITPDYVLDASSIIAGHTELYRAGTFPDIWVNQQNLILENRIYIPDQVRDEVGRRIDDASNWLNLTRSRGFQPTSDQHNAVTGRWMSLAQQHPRMASGADLWVIAWALELNAAAVSQEAPNRPNKIPTVIAENDGNAINLSGLIYDQYWQFVNAPVATAP